MTHITEGVISRYLDHMRVRNLSPLTIQQRRCALDRLSRHLDGPILYATADQMTAWQSTRSRTLSPGTSRTELSNVREFYRWAQREGFRADDPTIRLPMPRAPRRWPRPIADSALAEAMTGADPAMRAILGLAGFAGLRAAEIAHLDWSEVNLEAATPILLVACGKGGRARVVPLSPVLVELLRQLGPRGGGPVIARADGGAGATSPNAVTKRASAHLKACGITDRLHAGRHRFATAAYRGSLDIRAVGDLLGHSSPAVTAVYAAASPGATVDAALAAGKLAA